MSQPENAVVPKVPDGVEVEVRPERVDPEPEPDARVFATVTGSSTGARRPVVPAWARNRDELKAAGRWGAGHVGHAAAYHAVRAPKYATRAAVRSPVGAGRLVAGLARWALDLEGHPVRAEAVRRGDADTYMKLTRQRNERVRLRLLTIAAAAVLLTVAAVLLSLFAPAWAHWGTLAVVIVALAYAGSPADKPMVDTAVIVTRAQRLSSAMVERALASLGLAEVSKAVSRGGGITFPAPITRDGPGWRADVDLPYGVTVTDIIDRRERLASGLRRPLGTVWPEPAHNQHAGRLVLWVGDEDMSQAKPKPWPLAKEGKGDLFAAVPFGFDQRGRAVTVELMHSNVLIGAMPGAGKTMALRVLLLAAALDPSAELRPFELKGTGDLSMFEPVAHSYGSGADDGTVEACVETLREVYRELDRRARTIAKLPRDICRENQVTRDLAGRKALGLHPLVVAVDECQELFSHPDYGKEADRLATAIIKRGRALGVILLLATQRPDKDSLPTSVSANAGIRFCLRVMGQLENDMILGTSAYKNGTRATMLSPKDKGIGYLVGAADDPQIVRTAYLDQEAAERVITRARAARETAGNLTGHAAGEEPEREPSHSLLADLLAVVEPGEERVWSEVLCTRLAELRPDTYGGWDSATLAAALKPYGVTTAQVWAEGQNRRGVAVDTLREVADRHELTR